MEVANILIVIKTPWVRLQNIYIFVECHYISHKLIALHLAWHRHLVVLLKDLCLQPVFTVGFLSLDLSGSCKCEGGDIDNVGVSFLLDELRSSGGGWADRSGDAVLKINNFVSGLQKP